MCETPCVFVCCFQMLYWKSRSAQTSERRYYSGSMEKKLSTSMTLTREAKRLLLALAEKSDISYLRGARYNLEKHPRFADVCEGVA